MRSRHRNACPHRWNPAQGSGVLGRMRAHLMLGACVLVGGCAAVVTAEDLDVGDQSLPAPEDPPIMPHAIAGEAEVPHGPRASSSPPADIEVVTAEAHACIGDMLEDARARGESGGIWTAPVVIADDLSVRRLADVDGDGEGEWLVTHDPDCGVTGNCPHLLYRSSGCVIFAGAFWSAYESVLERTHRRLHDLETWTKGGCAGLEGSIRRLQWTSTGYRTYETIECSCDETDPARHPDCPGVE
jgi:hypothetical protein